MDKKDSGHTVTINIPRPREYVHESVSDMYKYHSRINKACEKANKKSPATIKKYSLLSRNKPVEIKRLEKDNLLLSYRLYAKKKADIKFKIARGTNLYEKYKIINEDLQKRLRVELPLDDVKSVTDIDDGFFRYLKGHPTNQRIPLYKSLKFQFFQQLRLRQDVGYRQDSILSITVNNNRELQIYRRSEHRYIAHIKSFNELIAEDYKKSMALVKNCEDLAIKLNDKVCQLQILANQQFLIQSRLIVLDYMYFKQQKYGRFLYYLSPPSWRAKHRQFARSVEIEEKGFDLGSSSEEDAFHVILEKMQNECCRGLIRPVLYFSHPDILMELFRSVEKQNLHHFSHVTQFAPRAKNLMMKIISFKKYVYTDTALITHMIENFEKLVGFCDLRELQLQKKFMKILHGLFFDSVAATDVLKLQGHLQFCYKKLCVEEPINMNLVSTAKVLEDMYMEYSFKLEEFTNDRVKYAMKHCVEGERNKVRRAQNAARELRLFNRLELALLTAYKNESKKETSQVPPISTTKKAAKRKTKHYQPKPILTASSQRELTDAETEYLALFTDWTENDDPAIYLKSLAIIDRINSVDK